LTGPNASKKKSVGQGKRTSCAECRCAISSKVTSAKLFSFLAFKFVQKKKKFGFFFFGK
jgi:hypothetical protein